MAIAITINLNDAQQAGWQTQLDRANKARTDQDLPEWTLEEYFQNNATNDGDRLNSQAKKRTALAKVMKDSNLSESDLKRLLSLGGNQG